MTLPDSEFWGSASMVLGLLAFLPYVYALYRGQAKPHCFTWFLWGLMMAIAFFAQIKGGAGPGAWITGVSAFAYKGIGLYGLFHGEKTITRTDWITLVFALAAIPLWYITNNPLYSVLLISAIDVMAFVPTYRKSWTKPFEEPISTFAITAVALGLSIVAMDDINMITAFYPATLALTDVVFVILLITRRRVCVPTPQAA
jgi:hypothetical protein